jgi:D-sedoheptulose 7-phosphate isomerase
MAIANDNSYEDIFIEQLKNFLKKDDVVIGISGSGNSMNVVKALEYANKVGAQTVALCGYSGGKIKNIVKISIHAGIDNMEIAEDVHIIVAHCIKNMIKEKLKNEVRY